MLSTIVWLKLSPETRKKIATQLGVPRSSGFDVQGGRVVSDGHTPQDLAHITTEKLQEATGLDISDFYALFENFVLQLEQGEVVKVEEPVVEKAPEVVEEPKKAETLFPEEPPKPVAKPNGQFANDAKKAKK
jgi:hypothetical protein